MKKTIIAAAALALIAGSVYAGNSVPAAPEIPPTVVTGEAEGSSSGIILPLVILVLVAAAVASN